LFVPWGILRPVCLINDTFCLETHHGSETEANYISEVTRDRRFLSKVTSVGSDPLLMHPFALRGTFFPSDITACLWSRFDQADSVLSWAKGWPGAPNLILEDSRINSFIRTFVASYHDHDWPRICSAS
jgi:hypothetical protein